MLLRVRRLPLLAAAAIALVATGCGFKQEPTGTTIAASYPLTVTDAAGRSVDLPHRPLRVAALDPGAAGILRRLGAAPSVLPDDAPAARIASTHPDLVVLPATFGRDEANSLAQELRVPTFIAGGGSLPPIEHASAELGVALGHGVAGRQLADGLRRQRVQVEQRIAGESPVSVFVDTGLGIPPPPNSLLVRLVQNAGGHVVGIGNGEPVTPGQLARLNPSFYLATSDSGVTLKSLRHHRATSQLPVVQDGRFLVVNVDDLAADARAYQLLTQIAHALHPGAFA
jgi:ABC-type Fe3+-hydroxamate transport system substrate-binding protein